MVTFILAAMLGMVTLRLIRSDSDLLQDEADRLVMLLHSAREESILRGQLIAFEMRPDGYRFLHIGEQGAFTVFEDGPLAARNLPPDMRGRLEIEGQQASGRHGLVLDPSSALPTFRIGFTLNRTDWWIQGGQDGKIRSLPTTDDKPS